MTKEELKKAAELIADLDNLRTAADKAKISKSLRISNEYNNVLVKLPMTQDFLAYLASMEQDVIDRLAELGIEVDE